MLNEYTAITTKIRGMHGKLLKKDDYMTLSYMTQQSEIVSFLKRHPGYQKLLGEVDETTITRTEIEGLLNSAVYEDFNKLFRFSNLTQRKFLQIHGITYEVAVIKKYLRRAFNVSELHQEIGDEYRVFLNKHSKLDLEALQAARTLEQFRESLDGSRFYRPLKLLEGINEPTLFDYETELDTFAFITIWQEKNKLLNKKEQKTLEQIYGQQFDLLNLIFVFRYKKFYDLPAEQIAPLLIPINHRLKPEKIRMLLATDSEDEFWQVVGTTYYAKYLKDFRSEGQLEELYNRLMDEVIQKRAKEEPYSAASIYAYLHDKEKEVALITRLIEAIHYGREVVQIQKVIDQNI